MICAPKEKILAAVTLPDDLSTHSTQPVHQWLAGGEQLSVTLKKKAFHPLHDGSARPSAWLSTPGAGPVPFCAPTQKRLGRRVTEEIAVVFKRAPNLLFRDYGDDDFGQNAVVISATRRGATIPVRSQSAGHPDRVRVTMDFGYGHAPSPVQPRACERLIWTCCWASRRCFPGTPKLVSWKILDPFENCRAARRTTRTVCARRLGPASADELLAVTEERGEGPVIVDLSDTTTSNVSKKIMALRERSGVIALSGVLTLVVVTRSGLEGGHRGRQ